VSDFEIGRPSSDEPEQPLPDGGEVIQEGFAEQDTIENDRVLEPQDDSAAAEQPEPEPGVFEQPAGEPQPRVETDPYAYDALPVTSERPELAVAGAFAGGLLLAMLLRRMGS
jgi:hypothetical protein